jgi:hypothetical protein
MNLQNIAAALDGEVSGDQVLAPGPGHSRVDRSLSVKLAPSMPDGFIVHSFAGDDFQTCKDHVKERLGTQDEWKRQSPKSKLRLFSDFNTAKKQDEIPRKAKLGQVVANYDYLLADGTPYARAVRYEPKDFRQQHWDGNRWIFGGAKGDPIPYRLPEMKRAVHDTVFVVEGEKDADNLGKRGFVATTNIGGAGNWKPALNQHFAGKVVYILPDNDKAGADHAVDVARHLHGIAASVRIVNLPGPPHKGDVSDWIDAGRDLSGLVDFCKAVQVFDPAASAEEEHREEPGADRADSQGDGQDQPEDEERQDRRDSQGKQQSYNKSTGDAGRAQAPIELFWHGDRRDQEARAWVVDKLLPERGAGLMSGQWGTAKTFVGVDISASVMTGTPFAGREVTRRGGVLFVAAEGASEIPSRLAGVVEHKLLPAAVAAGTTVHLERLPFAWIEECPPLKDDDAFGRLVATALQAAAHIKEQFELPLVLILIDTLNAAANFKDGNDAAEGQLVMNRLQELSRRTGALTLAVDHFGKAVETGTRGTSAKEAAADVVLALLAERDTAGAISNTRMAVRKLRAGATGSETPFSLKTVDIGDGETTCVIEWKAEHAPQGAHSDRKERWTKSVRLFRSAMQAALIDHGRVVQPYGGGGPTVRAVAGSAVRTEFMAAYPAGEDKGAEAKRKAFNRALKTARERDLICSREITGVDYLWFVGTDDGQDNSTIHKPDGQDT